MPAPELVVLGNLLVDDVVLPDGRTRMAEPGGATLYASLAAALWGVRVGVVSWRGDDYPRWALEALAARGVDLAGVHATVGRGLRTWLLYEGTRRRVVHRLDGPSHEDVSPGFDQIPGAWRAARAFHLAPMPFDVQARLVGALAGLPRASVSLDPHLAVREDTLQQWRAILAGVDALFLSEDELQLTLHNDDPATALALLEGGRLELVLFKRGARGGLLYGVRERQLQEWPAMAVRVVDPTGAGDAFAAGFLAGGLKGDSLLRALRRGAVSASFAVEDWGCAGLLHATSDQAEARLREWFGD